MKYFVMSLIFLSSASTWGISTKSKLKSKPKAKPTIQAAENKADPNEVLCDEKKEITPRLLAKKMEHDSETFRKNYTGIYQDFDNSIRKICEFLKRCEFSSNKEDDSDIRNQYSATLSGKRSQADLEKLRKEFRYNSVDQYLFDDHELNDLKNAKSTHMIKSGDRTYYLDEQKVIGFFDQVGEEGILTRYDHKCNVSELVSFSSLTSLDNAIRMKVTKKYCTSAQNKGPTFKHTDEMLQEMGAYIQNVDRVEDQMEAQQMCEFWLPKPEPFGLVIDANAPTEKSLSKSKKKSVTSSSTSKRPLKPAPTKRKKKVTSSQP